MKTLSTREVNENVSRALQEAQHQPLLVRRADRPSVWMVSADDVARVAGEIATGRDLYHHVLELVAVNLFDQGVITMGQAARLLGTSLDHFIDLCDRLEVPVLRETGRSVGDQVNSFERWLAAQPADGS